MLFNCPQCGRYSSANETRCNCGYVFSGDSRNTPPPQARQTQPEYNYNLMACPDCGHSCSRAAVTCPACGRPFQAQAPMLYAPPPQMVMPYNYAPPYAPKSRAAYVLLGLFFGCLGIHNFYADRAGVGAAQLIITLTLGWFCLIGVAISAFWAFIEIIAIDTDGRGYRMT